MLLVTKKISESPGSAPVKLSSFFIKLGTLGQTFYLLDYVTLTEFFQIGDRGEKKEES